MKKCGTCAVHDKNSGRCGLHGTFDWQEDDGCTKWMNEVIYCDICNLPMLPKEVIVDGTIGKLLCPNCSQYLNTCFTCKNQCLIDGDKSGKPKMVEKAIERGNMTFMMQVLNPELVEEYCGKCICGGEDKQCRRRNGWCSNYEMKGR